MTAACASSEAPDDAAALDEFEELDELLFLEVVVVELFLVLVLGVVVVDVLFCLL